MDYEVVWITDVRRFAFLISRNAYYSVVCYTPDTVGCFLIDNDDYELWEERATDYESD